MDIRFLKGTRANREWLLDRVLKYVRQTYPQVEANPSLYGDYESFVVERVVGGKRRQVGGLLIRFEGGIGEIHAVCTSSLFREELARRRLMEYLDYIGPIKGTHTWTTTVRADNHDVIDALEFCGFRQDKSGGRTQFLSYSREV